MILDRLIEDGYIDFKEKDATYNMLPYEEKTYALKFNGSVLLQEGG